MKTPLFIVGLMAALAMAADTPDAEKSQVALPPMGKELSTVPGVSIIRVADDSEVVPRQFSISAEGEPGQLKSDGHTLLEILPLAAGLGPTRVFVRAKVPGGDYKVTVSTETGGRERVFQLLGDAYERAFGLRVTLEKRHIDVLVLKTADNWAKDGFKATKATNNKWQGWHVGRPRENRLHWLEFQGDMDLLAGQLEKSLGKVVLNETGLEGRFEGRLEYREGALLADLVNALRQRGLLLQPATRKAEAVFVEAAKK